MGGKVDALLRAGLLLIEDACPPDPGAYLCRQCAVDDVCSECWRRYLFDIANGRRQLPAMETTGRRAAG